MNRPRFPATIPVRSVPYNLRQPTLLVFKGFGDDIVRGYHNSFCSFGLLVMKPRQLCLVPSRHACGCVWKNKSTNFLWSQFWRLEVANSYYYRQKACYLLPTWSELSPSDRNPTDIIYISHKSIVCNKGYYPRHIFSRRF